MTTFNSPKRMINLKKDNGQSFVDVWINVDSIVHIECKNNTDMSCISLVNGKFFTVNNSVQEVFNKIHEATYIAL